jgi:hypothetical protein
MATALYGKAQGSQILEYQEFAEPIDDQSQLPPNKPKWLKVVPVNDAYDPVSQVRTGPVEAVDAPNSRITWTYTVRAKNADEINGMRQNKLNLVHGEATKRLTPKSGAALSQQIMALSRLMQMIYKNTNWAAWSQADKDTVQTSINRLQAAQTNRDVEDAKVGELQALNDPTAINNYDAMTGWPAS